MNPVLTFDEITLGFIQSFHTHEVISGNLLNTVYKKHAIFKFFLGLAIDKEYISKNPYNKFKIKKIMHGQNPDILSENELHILQEAYDKGKYIGGKREVLRNFLFSCYTSLSYAEFQNVKYVDLKPVIIKENDKETTYALLCNQRLKTKVKYKIPIVSPVIESLLERKSENACQHIFSPLTNWRTNKLLKEIISELNIDKNMTFHTGRHRENFYRLLISRVYRPRFGIGNDLGTSNLLYSTLFYIQRATKLSVKDKKNIQLVGGTVIYLFRANASKL